MKKEYIQITQQAYRMVLDGMAKPGTIQSLGELSQQIDLDVDCFPATSLLMLMLLDTETGFQIISKRGTGVANYIKHLTGAKISPVEEADYIFVLRDAAPAEIESSIAGVKAGTLINPDQSATLICETGGVTMLPQLILSGPGIEIQRPLTIQLSGNWLEKRGEQNSDYPMGIDMIFVDARDNLVCLPRTTQIQKMR